MKSVLKYCLAGASALGVTLGSLPANAAWVASPAAVSTAKVGNLETVGWRERRGYGGGGGYYGGRRYGGGYGHRHRGGRNYGGYAAAGIVGLTAGALIAGAGRDRYYDDSYYAPRRAYVERRRYARCESVRYRENRYGEVVRVVTYRPC